ncbi:S-adenosyl-L-methionine-dependent methyltransferase [Mycobacterium sp. 1245111.1]|uniref:YceI family protein n=1 Tax=Mycobacterium sp. 1245111.1 TaxID=1834073 RepID=UPI0007FC2039|nr:YceI family protein [Mycobacterium sp. 1245111.1]OBK39333.1 S-adenosyl-L-methionine-dependent methyltransferase [Mycobacterium sp. 1245111.1]
MTGNDAAEWSLDGSDGYLLIHTGVAGPAAAMGHRLTLAMRRWRATTRWDADEPVAADLAVEVGSLEVVRGEGGVTPLSAPEKILVRSNALRSLDVKRYPRITFAANDIEKINDGYRLTGALTIQDTSRAQVVDLRVDDQGDNWWLSSETTVQQTEFGIKPYSQLLGSLKVADDVVVAFSAKRAKHS